MLRLLIKDIKVLRKDWKSFVFLYLAMPMASLLFSDDIYMEKMGVVFLITVLTAIMSFSYDDKGKSQKLILSLPVTRKELVLSKYIIVPIFIAINFSFAYIYSLIFNYLGLSSNSFARINENMGVILIILVVVSICLPWYFVFSHRVAWAISLMVTFGFNNAFSSIFRDRLPFTGGLYTSYGGLGALGLGLIILLFSAGISIAAHKGKDL